MNHHTPDNDYCHVCNSRLGDCICPPCPACVDTLDGVIDEAGQCNACGHYIGACDDVPDDDDWDSIIDATIAKNESNKH